MKMKAALVWVRSQKGAQLKVTAKVVATRAVNNGQRGVVFKLQKRKVCVVRKTGCVHLRGLLNTFLLHMKC